MLRLDIRSDEMWDDNREEFVAPIIKSLRLEHSLYTISMWEEKYHKPFLTQKEFSSEELLDYIQMMADSDIDQATMSMILKYHIPDIEAYMNDAATATKFYDVEDDSGPTKIITSEIFYWQMAHYHIPVDFQHWHIQRLITLIRVCQEKEGDTKPNKKATMAEIMARNRKLNQERRAKMHSKG